MDAQITAWINGLSGPPFLDAVMRAAAEWGLPLMVVLVALQWWSPQGRTRSRHVVLVAGLAFLLGLALNQGVLLAIHRVRPYDLGVTRLLLGRSPDWSFPSDHATGAVAVASVFWIKRLRLRKVLFSALAALICFARVYLGIHYVGDILGGAVTGALAAWLVAKVWQPGNRAERLAVRVL